MNHFFKIDTMSVRPLLFILLLLSVGSVALAAKRVEVKPKASAGSVEIVSMGKTRTYYTLSAERWTVVDVKGPGVLRVLSRVQFTSPEREELDYSIIYRIDGSEEKSFDVEEALRSANARYKDGTVGNPGAPENLTFTISRGYHTVEFRLARPSPPVSVRFLLTPHKQRKTRWVQLAPLSPCEPVDLFAGEATAHYYRFSAEKPLRIDLIGPTDIRIMTRVENTFDMKGRANYRLQIRERGNVLQTFQLSSQRSETTTYRNNQKLVPGKAREIVFRVPKGRHQYEISGLDRGTLLGQIMFPQKDARLGL
jgi:hypothetical protein